MRTCTDCSVGECPGDEAVDKYSMYSRKSDPESQMLQMVFHFHQCVIWLRYDRVTDVLAKDLTGLRAGLAEAATQTGSLATSRRSSTHGRCRWRSRAGGTRTSTLLLIYKRKTDGSLENHDQPRTISRIASDHPEDRAKSAKLLAMFHATLTGTLFVYQGQEWGLCNVPRDWSIEEYKDIETIQNLEGEREYRRKQQGVEDPDMSDVIKDMRETARDNGRTPMQVSVVTTSTACAHLSGTPARTRASPRASLGCVCTTTTKSGTSKRRGRTLSQFGRSGRGCCNCGRTTKRSSTVSTTSPCM